MNEARKGVKNVNKRLENNTTNLTQLCFYDDNANDKTRSPLEAAHAKVNLRRDLTFVKFAPEKENYAPQNTDVTLPRAKEKEKTDQEKDFRKTKEVVNSMRRPQSANIRRTSSLGKISGGDRTRSASPSSSKPTTPSSANSVIKKFGTYHLKILGQLDYVKKSLYWKPEEPESLNEINKQKKRATEFAVRFSRNHLYQLRRLVNEIKKIIVPYPFDSLTGSDCEHLFKKIYLAYQTASQALQTYNSYVTSTQSPDIPEKVKELIFLIRDLYLCCEHLCIPLSDDLNQENQGDILKKCKDLVNNLDVKITENEEKGKKKKKESDFTKDNRVPSERYSMYKVKLTNSNNWKKKTETLAKIKFGSPTGLGKKRVKRKDDKKAQITCDIYTQKMHPKCGKYFGSKFVKFDPMKVAENPKNQPAAEKKIFVRKNRYNTPREVTSQDDDIETMVQTVLEDDNSTGGFNQASGELKQDDSDDSSPLDKSEFREILIEAINNLDVNGKEEQKSWLKKLVYSMRSSPKQRADKVPNVKVFHIKSKDMIPKPEDQTIAKETPKSVEQLDLVQLYEEQKEKEYHSLQERRLNAHFLSHNGQQTSNKFCDEEHNRHRGKIKLELPENLVRNVSKYKKTFNDFCKSNIMYQTNNSKRPWELVERISDRLVNEMLKETARGLENDVILKRLYLNELIDAV